MCQIVSNHGKIDESGMPHKRRESLKIQQNQAFMEVLAT